MHGTGGFSETGSLTPRIAAPIPGMVRTAALELQMSGGYVPQLAKAEHIGWLPVILPTVDNVEPSPRPSACGA